MEVVEGQVGSGHRGGDKRVNNDVTGVGGEVARANEEGESVAWRVSEGVGGMSRDSGE